MRSVHYEIVLLRIRYSSALKMSNKRILSDVMAGHNNMHNNMPWNNAENQTENIQIHQT